MSLPWKIVWALVAAVCVVAAWSTPAAAPHPFTQRPSDYREQTPGEWAVDCQAGTAERGIHVRAVGWLFADGRWVAQYTGHEWDERQVRPVTDTECAVLGGRGSPEVFSGSLDGMPK